MENKIHEGKLKLIAQIEKQIKKVQNKKGMLYSKEIEYARFLQDTLVNLKNNF